LASAVLGRRVVADAQVEIDRGGGTGRRDRSQDVPAEDQGGQRDARAAADARDG